LKIKNIILENEQLKKQVASLEAQLARKQYVLDGVKSNLRKVTDERNELLGENMKRIEESNRLYGELQDIKHLSVWEFANLYCNEEEHAEAGHALAKDLLGR